MLSKNSGPRKLTNPLAEPCGRLQSLKGRLSPE